MRSSSVNFNPFNIPGNSLEKKRKIKNESIFQPPIFGFACFTDANKASMRSL